MFGWRTNTKPDKPLPTRVTWDDQAVHVYANDIEIESFRWSELRCVRAYKQDCWGIDRIWIAFDSDGMEEPVCLHEEVDGYQHLINEMERRCAGYRADWWGAVAFPAFALNHTIVWHRDGTPLPAPVKIDEPAAAASPITLDSPLTLRNAFLFPIQHRRARIEVLIGALLLFIPVLGWMFNMGHRLRLVHRLQRGEPGWPAWGGYGELLRHGAMTTAVIIVFHTPAALIGLAAHVFDRPALWGLAAAALACGLYVLPGFMTFYAKDYDVNVLLDVPAAVRRVLGGGRAYLRAWLIALTAVTISFLGLLALGIGFLITSVWFWQVAAFCFGSVFSKQGKIGDAAARA